MWGMSKGYWFILFSDAQVSWRNKMSTVLITGRTDGKKTKTVTTPVETQPTVQNKQTKKHQVTSFEGYNPHCKVFLHIYSCLFVFLHELKLLTYFILSASYVINSFTQCLSLLIFRPKSEKNFCILLPMSLHIVFT